MALRALALTLIPKSSAIVVPLICSRLSVIQRGRYSSSPEVVEIEICEEGESDLAAGTRLLEDAIHRAVVRKSAPAWLPFLPGSSYWVPPRRSLQSHPGMAQLIGRIANPLTEEETLSLRTIRGCPSSAYFIEEQVL